MLRQIIDQYLGQGFLGLENNEFLGRDAFLAIELELVFSECNPFVHWDGCNQLFRIQLLSRLASRVNSGVPS